MRFLIINAKIVNEGRVIDGACRVADGLIDEVLPAGEHNAPVPDGGEDVIDAGGQYLIPGVIDTQVHFREPGLTHKATIATESRAAAAGGTTSYFEMPNTDPPTIDRAAWDEKNRIAAQTSLVNYAFYVGATAENLPFLASLDPREVCGIKFFMSGAHGPILISDTGAIEKILTCSSLPVTVHCEDDSIIQENANRYRERFGEDVPVEHHPEIRSRAACLSASQRLVGLAKKHQSRLHILHVSTEDELSLFEAGGDRRSKRITSEACVHHLWFTDADYAGKKTLIKWNPAVKRAGDRDALLAALKENRIDIIATDHAPHTLEEKQQSYFKAPSGGPLVQHSLVLMMEYVLDGRFAIEWMVDKMCHAPADIFQIEKRGYIRPGYAADLVLLDPAAPWTVDSTNILSKCGWSPFEGMTFRSRVTRTFVNGQTAYHNGRLSKQIASRRLTFNRPRLLADI